MADKLAKKVASRFVTSMAAMIRNVAGHDWGWFSREDERMHVQSVEEDARVGPKKSKAWLETNGKRTFEVALKGNVGASDWKKLEAKVKAERAVLESRWITFMIRNNWLKATLKGSIVTLTAYPSSHNRFTRTLDLRKLFPGAYEHRPTWDEKPPPIELDREYGMLAVGDQANPDHRDHIELSEFLFID